MSRSRGRSKSAGKNHAGGLLVVEGLQKRFGGVNAVNGCTFTVREGAITALIGPNGAGKTTVFNLITGLIRPDAGSIEFKGEPLTDLRPFEINRVGLARTFQMLRLFSRLTVIENLMVAHPGATERPWDRLFRPLRVRDEEAAKERRAHGLLEMVSLEGKQDAEAGDLSYGQQKLLDIARCLATEADVLLLDEPVAGVNPRIRDHIKRLLAELKGEGRTILLIEHDMTFVMELADTVIVLDHGEKIAEGPPARIRKDRRVIKAYLGATR